ncbi:MAG: hypothetical protein V3S14_05045, partial [Anaerolineae bacterium]
ANVSEGIEYPLQVNLTCYQVLNATGVASAIERAHAILSQAHVTLLERATSISDSTLRHKFLENVRTNREIIAAWEEKTKSP